MTLLKGYPMISSITRLTSSDLKQILKLKLQIEAYERQLVAIHAEARKRPKPTAAQRRLSPRASQPSLRDMISGILRKSKEPMSVQEIYEATLLAGYFWRSQEPINALNVKMYTDSTFKKASPGRFVMRKGT